MPDTSESNPLGIIMHDEGDGPEAYLPLRFVPEDYLEAKRAELLEFNSKDGLRKLTDEERERMNDVADTAESVQADAEQAEPLDLLPGEGFG